MKKYAKTVSCDSRGQLVIPKEVRKELSIEEGTAFWVFIFEEEGILLKRASEETLEHHDHVVKELYDKSDKLGIDKRNITKAIQNYMKKETGGFREI